MLRSKRIFWFCNLLINLFIAVYCFFLSIKEKYFCRLLGSDHASHPFGIHDPGVFISRITPNGPAARSGAFRIGDRILKVGNFDVSKSTHNDVVNALKNSPEKLTITVRHDPQPPGLREIVVSKRPDEMLGMNIIGGSKTGANPLDKTDEGIFIGNVKEGGAVAKNGKVKAGMRVLEVSAQFYSC